MPKDLYSAEIENVSAQPRTTIQDFRHAFSPKQASMFFARQYPYPPYVIKYVKNETTGTMFTLDDALGGWRTYD